MATTALSAFVPDIAYRVDGCPDPVIERAVLDSCIEFCELSGVLKRTLDPEPLAAGSSEFDIPIASSEQLVSILSLACDGATLLPVAEDSADYDVLFGSSTGTPRAYIEVSPGTVKLYPAPAEACTIYTRVSVKPSRTASSVDSVLFNHWKDAIIDGALARLFALPEQWGNAVLASHHMSRFLSAVSGARVEAVKGNTRAQRRVYGPRFC